MTLGSGEVLERSAAALRRHEAQVRLVAAANQHARLCLTLPQHAFDEWVRRKRTHHLAAGTDCQDVDVAARVSPTADAADDFECGARNVLRQMLHERRRDEGSVGQEMPIRVLFAFLERL